MLLPVRQAKAGRSAPCAKRANLRILLFILLPVPAAAAPRCEFTAHKKQFARRVAVGFSGNKSEATGEEEERET
jgi:hypothetical protein